MTCTQVIFKSTHFARRLGSRGDDQSLEYSAAWTPSIDNADWKGKEGKSVVS